MTKEEAIATGINPQLTKHTMHRRAKWHNYRRKGLYMLTLVTRDRQPVLGHLVSFPTHHIRLSELGGTIRMGEVPKMSSVYPNVAVWRIIIMPDHIHILVEVTEDFPEKKHLGSVVLGFKTGCNRAYHAHGGEPGMGLFEKGYHDRIILPGMVAEQWKRYIEDNPRRLAMKRENPDLFVVMHDRKIADRNCQLVGNIFLLDIPDKMSVVVHRADTDADFARKKKEWLKCGERGGVLVSAAIAPREKEVMREAMNRGYNLIFIRNNGFPELYKPGGEAFDACTEGRLLQISPSQEYRMQHETITRAECLALNVLADAIAKVG